MDVPAAAGAAKMGTGIAKAVPIVGNLVAAYVQLAGIAITEQALGTATGLAEVENKSRVAGAMSLLASTFSDSVDRGMQALGITELSAGRSVVLRFVARWAPFGAKVFGVAGAAIGAVCDLVAMGRNLIHGDGDLAASYGLSALGGALVVIALSSGGLPLLLVGALIYVFAQVLIAKLGDNKLDVWLKRCIWGKDASNRYLNVEQEMSALPSLAGV